jgi:cytochrome c2
MEARLIVRLGLVLVTSVAGFVSSAFAQHAGDPIAGAEYAKKFCTKCHALNQGEISPEPTAPPFGDVANTKGMTAAALTVWLTTSHPTMPNIVIEPHDMDDVVAYILSPRK